MTKKDITDIEYFKGKSWNYTQKFLKSNAHMLALGNSKEGMLVAKSVEESGEEAGTAVLAAFLALRNNGLPNIVAEAVNIYKNIAKEVLSREGIAGELKKRAETLSHRVHNLEYFVYFLSGYGSSRKFEYPLKMPEEMWADLGNRSGMANVLMGIALKNLDESVTTEYIAMVNIARFLKEGFEGREE